MKSISFLIILIPFLFFATICSAQSEQLKLAVNPISLENGGKIEFYAKRTDQNNPSAISLIGKSLNYEIYVGNNICEYNDQFRYFKYVLFIKHVGTNEWSCFDLIMTPYGQFTDHSRSKMVFTISQGVDSEDGEMQLPLHSLSDEQYLNVALLQGTNEIALNDIYEVKLGFNRKVLLILKNNLKDIQLVVHNIELSYSQPEYWINKKADSNKELTIEGGKESVFDEFEINPHSLRIIPNILFRVKSGEDAQMKLKITYSTKGGGKTRELLAFIKVQFVPSLSYLLLAILLGAFLGVLCRIIYQKQKFIQAASLLGIAKAFVGTIVLDLIGILLVSCESEFKIFGLTLNPFQFLHVMVLAILVGLLGLNIIDLIKKIPPFKRGNQQNN